MQSSLKGWSRLASWIFLMTRTLWGGLFHVSLWLAGSWMCLDTQIQDYTSGTGKWLTCRGKSSLINVFASTCVPFPCGKSWMGQDRGREQIPLSPSKDLILPWSLIQTTVHSRHTYEPRILQTRPCYTSSVRWNESKIQQLTVETLESYTPNKWAMFQRQPNKSTIKPLCSQAEYSRAGPSRKAPLLITLLKGSTASDPLLPAEQKSGRMETNIGRCCLASVCIDVVSWWAGA